MSNSLGPDRARHIKFSSDRPKFSSEHPFFVNRLSVLTHCLILRTCSKLMTKHDLPFRVDIRVHISIYPPVCLSVHLSVNTSY